MQISFLNKARFFGKAIFKVVCASAFIISLASCDDETPTAEITGFAFRAAENSFLSEDISGVISGNKITVKLPEDLYTNSENRSALKPSISYGESTRLVGSGNFDFAKSPVQLAVTSGDDSTVNYLVVLEKQAAPVQKGALLFTEYYMGAEYAYKGACNQWIEITNLSESSIDLSAVELTRNVWTSGKRIPSQDKTVTLSGTLESGKSFVLYSDRIASGFTGKFSAGSLQASDSKFNSILTVCGQDGFTLTSNGVVLDVLGSDDAKSNRARWGYAKKLERKPQVDSYTAWNEDEWLITEAKNDKNDGSTAGATTLSTTVSDTSADVSYFALEDFDDIVYGAIDTTAKTVSVRFNESDSLNQVLTLGTTGKKAVFSETGEEIVNGKTKIDFSNYSTENPLKIKVYPFEGEATEYSVSKLVVHYNFNDEPSGTYALLSEKPQDNDVVMIYYPKDSQVLKTTANGAVLNGKTVTPTDNSIKWSSGLASLCVTVDEDGYYTFTNDGKYLTSGETGNSLSYEENPSRYSIWALEETSEGSGIFYVKNINAAFNGKGQSLEYYSNKKGFTTYNHNTTDVYKFQFYKKQ